MSKKPREIKFRVWQKEEEYMFKVARLDLADNTVYPQLFGRGELLEECVLMQSTGKFDENDIEVFEGDIIAVKRLSFDDDYKYDVFNYLIEWDKNYTGYDPFQDDYSYPDEGFKIIGNIFENPELF